MRWLVRASALLLVLMFTLAAAAGPKLRTLVGRLESASDFRVRVRAALELGRLKQREARPSLEHALDDSNPAVRAAAAAALKVLGDRGAIPALRRHRRDESAAVRSQVTASIKALESAPDSGSDGATVLVKLGEISASQETEPTGKVKRNLLGQLKHASRKRLGTLPGVRVLGDGEDARGGSKKAAVPVVMVTGRLRAAELSREGGVVVYSAKVEYVMHRMPERSIASLVSGSAKGTAAESVVGDKKRLAALRREVLSAAVASAMRRAPEAIRAAMK